MEATYQAKAADRVLDASGMNCPLPILKTRKALSGMATGETLRVLATDPGSMADIAAFCAQTGHALLSSAEEDGRFVYSIRKQ